MNEDNLLYIKNAYLLSIEDPYSLKFPAPCEEDEVDRYKRHETGLVGYEFTFTYETKEC